jgi:hypothetical protein
MTRYIETETIWVPCWPHWQAVQIIDRALADGWRIAFIGASGTLLKRDDEKLQGPS